MVRTLLVDGLLTLFTYMPYKVYSLSMHVLPDLPPSMSLLTVFYIELVVLTLTVTNGFTTPIVYCCLNKDFKVSAVKVWHLCVLKIYAAVYKLQCRGHSPLVKPLKWIIFSFSAFIEINFHLNNVLPTVSNI